MDLFVLIAGPFTFPPPPPLTPPPPPSRASPPSSWNVYIAENTIDTGDDCIAVKAGRDWSGRMVRGSGDSAGVAPV